MHDGQVVMVIEAVTVSVMGGRSLHGSDTVMVMSSSYWAMTALALSASTAATERLVSMLKEFAAANYQLERCCWMYSTDRRD